MDVRIEESTGNRVPGEFKYLDHKNSFYGKFLRWSLRTVFGVDPILPDEVIRTYANSYYEADPVAEDFVAEVYLKQGQDAGRALLNQALENGVESIKDAPDSLKKLFAEVENLPEWVDMERVERGGRIFRRFGTHMFTFAGAITLHGYRENSVAKPLAFTGAYSGASANKRFLETASFWIDVSGDGAMRPGGAGIRTALKVRMMHVFIRARLIQHPDWDLESWGVPISQGDALLTLMGGSFIPGYGLKLLGYRTSTEEIEDMMHFWRYVGYIMGVQPKWYPADVKEALGLMYTSEMKGVARSGADGVDLAKSYLESYSPTEEDDLFTKAIKSFEHKLQLGYTSLFIPPWSYAEFGLPKPGPWRLHPFLQFPFVYLKDTLRKNSPAFEKIFDGIARKEAGDWVKARLGERTTDYQAAESFTR